MNGWGTCLVCLVVGSEPSGPGLGAVERSTHGPCASPGGKGAWEDEETECRGSGRCTLFGVRTPRLLAGSPKGSSCSASVQDANDWNPASVSRITFPLTHGGSYGTPHGHRQDAASGRPKAFRSAPMPVFGIPRIDRCRIIAVLLRRAHMESMLMAAAARHVQTDLARRVGSWRQRIDPLLKVRQSFGSGDNPTGAVGQIGRRSRSARSGASVGGFVQALHP